MAHIRDMTLVLASSSPRRIQMFQDHGFSPVVFPPQVNETVPLPMNPEETVMFLAMKKALAVKAQGFFPAEDTLILAADTIVVLGNEILGKPVSRSDALAILTKLSGHTHRVITGVALVWANRPLGKLFFETSHVTFSPYKPHELHDYLNTPEPYDKAGAYAIQGSFGKYVQEFRGDYTNIMGLPWDRTQKELELYYSSNS